MSAVPMLAYADGPAAIEFLCRAFGFRVTMRVDGADGTVSHAELVVGDGKVMLSGTMPETGYCSPNELDGVHGQVCVDVDDVDAHYARAHDAGAVVIGPPADQNFGVRTYQAIDLEGHRWFFMGPIR